MRHRLYHRIFHSLLLFVLLSLGLTALAGHLLLSELFRTHLGAHLRAQAEAIARELPAEDRPPSELQAAVERVASLRPVKVAVWSANGRRLAFTDTDLPRPRLGVTTVEWLSSPAGSAAAIPIPGGRILVLQPRRLPRPGGFLLFVVALAALLAVASYPVARLVTRRLETLEVGVRRLGEGDLGARVEVRGEDELASLAGSFNLAAERLQRLVEAQRRVLASASHELRSPLARLRMALELLRDQPGVASDRIEGAVAEVEELDTLVEELLLAGRLEVLPRTVPAEPVDAAELLALEAARTGATVHARPSPLGADPRLLRVLVRNLLENAKRHSAGAPVEAGAQPLGGENGAVRIWVADRGPGVPEGERERIFEPFYRPAGHREGADGGVGLGLYLVRRIAEWYGGSASSSPRDGGGTCFEVILRGAAAAATSSPGDSAPGAVIAPLARSAAGESDRR